jgi:hypothetical protein
VPTGRGWSASAEVASALDFSRTWASAPARVARELPATCRVGEQLFKPDAAPGKNLYLCTDVGRWTAFSP